MGLLKDVGTGFLFGLGGAAYTVVASKGLDLMMDWEVEHDEYLRGRKNYTPYNETPTQLKGPDMNIAKKALHRTQKFVVDHKVAVAVTVATATTVVLMDKLRGAALSDHVEFLKEKNLHDEYINWITTPAE